jgi:hypothetical protein
MLKIAARLIGPIDRRRDDQDDVKQVVAAESQRQKCLSFRTGEDAVGSDGTGRDCEEVTVFREANGSELLMLMLTKWSGIIVMDI